MLKIAIQGELGSFHHAAVMKLFGDNIEIIPCPTFMELFAIVNENRPDTIGLTAVENSLHGPINEVYTLLEKSPAKIFAETELAIAQNLIGLKNAKKTEIKEIYSHPVALVQCENYLAQHFPKAEKIEYEDTAAAVRFIAELNDPTKAAIASVAAAELYHDRVKILAPSIQDDAVNFTRFVAIAAPKRVAEIREKYQLPVSQKSSIVLITNHQPGTLVAALSQFTNKKINLLSLVSRPIIGQKWQYKFYVDFAANAELSTQIIADLRATGNQIVELGNY
jgi:prephenate dehydratase